MRQRRRDHSDVVLFFSVCRGGREPCDLPSLEGLRLFRISMGRLEESDVKYVPSSIYITLPVKCCHDTAVIKI